MSTGSGAGSAGTQGSKGTGTKPTTKKKGKPAGAGGNTGIGGSGARRPKKAHAPPVQGSAAKSMTPIGAPLAQALTGPLADLQKASDDVGKVASMMGLPRTIAAEGAVSSFLSRIYTTQAPLTYCVAWALSRAAKSDLPIDTKTTPEALILGQRKCLVFDEARRAAAQGQIMAADGRLFLGARFTFFFKKVLALYQRRLSSGTTEQQLNTLRAFGNIDRIRFRILTAAQNAAAGTQSVKSGLKQTLGEQQDAAAFDSAQQTMSQGLRPELPVLQAALRHAQRLDELHGFGLSPPDIGQGQVATGASTASGQSKNKGQATNQRTTSR